MCTLDTAQLWHHILPTAHIHVTFNTFRCRTTESHPWIIFMTHEGDPYVSWRQGSHRIAATRNRKVIGPLFQWPCVTMVTIHMTYRGIWLRHGDSSHCAVNKSYSVFNVIRGTIPVSNVPQAFQEEMSKKDLWNGLTISEHEPRKACASRMVLFYNIRYMKGLNTSFPNYWLSGILYIIE